MGIFIITHNSLKRERYQKTVALGAPIYAVINTTKLLAVAVRPFQIELLVRENSTRRDNNMLSRMKILSYIRNNYNHWALVESIRLRGVVRRESTSSI
jgi:hypothetical protein